MTSTPFLKMHGLGNDFVVVDARADPVALSDAQIRAIAHRRTGIGCDQLIVLEPAESADTYMRTYNADGGEVEICGNATRCVASLLAAEKGAAELVIDTRAGALRAWDAGDGMVTVDVGAAHFGWREIPLAREMDTLHLDFDVQSPCGTTLRDPSAVNVGNPHAVFFVDPAEVEAIDLAEVGPVIEHDTLFPERVNVSIAALTGEDSVRLRVWERGTGITAACGTAACAATVASHRRGLTGRAVAVDLNGGRLSIEWREDDHIIMTGPVATSFRGDVDPELLAVA